MLQLKNAAPFASSISVLPNQHGVDTLYVVVKVTFTLQPVLALAETAVGVSLVDEYFGDPESSSLKSATELHLGKPGTDVVLMGSAWAPEGRRVEQCLVSLRVAERRVVARVFGDRRWKASGFTPPEPFESIPLVYERAYGGQQRTAEGQPVLADERNPVGTGFRGTRSTYDMIGQPLPNIEDPVHPIVSADDHPTPVGFGFVAPSWYARRRHAGTYDESWKKTRAPYLPRDFNSQFFHAAPEAFRFERPLRGGEPIEVIGASRRNVLNFSVPGGAPQVSVQLAGQSHTPATQLETILIEPDANRVSFSYRAAQPCDKQALKIQRVDIGMGDLQTSAHV